MVEGFFVFNIFFFSCKYCGMLILYFTILVTTLEYAALWLLKEINLFY